MLFERLVQHDRVRNLVWGWEAAPPSFGPGPNGGFSAYFPGLLHVDALQLAVSQTHSRFRSDVFLHAFAVSKPIGLSVNGPAPDPAFFARETDWAWFVLGPPTAGSAPSAQTLQPLYSDPRVVSR